MFRSRLIAPYQHEGLNWIMARERGEVPGGFLCDEMGLGKTVQMLAAMTLNLRPKTLVLVPKSLVSQWRSEIKRFVPTFNVKTFDGPKREMPVFDENPWVVVAPYSVIGERKGQPRSPLMGVNWDRVILDEAHEIRNPKSKLHIACRALKADIRWVLTGTPIFNSLRDFVSLGTFIGLNPQYIRDNTDDVRRTHVMRRTKQDVTKYNIRLQLPPLDFQNVELEMYPEERAVYEEAFEQGRQIAGQTTLNQLQYIQMLLEAFLRLRQICVWPQMYKDGIARKEGRDPEEWNGRSKKLETLMEMLLSHRKEKSIVFCQFIGEMDRIQALISTQGITTFRIDGSVDEEQREQQIAAFKADTTGAVFLIQIKAGGVGLNLQEATRIYITCPAWNPATELQAIGRAHRTGQTQKVTVRRFIYLGEENLPSVEQSILQLQETKVKVCAEVLNDERLVAQMPARTQKISVHQLKKLFSV
jgi:SNF2 family DNA or RNA helicase